MRSGAWVIGVLILVAGCATPRVEKPLTGTVGGNDMGEQLEFWHQLSERPMTSNDEGFHGVLLYLDKSDPAKDYAGRVGALQGRKLLPAGFDRPADEAMERGTLAVILVRLLEMEKGWALSVFGGSPRYAVRELEFARLYPPSSPNQTFSGAEFVGIMGRVEDVQRGNSANLPAEMMPGEMEGK